MSVNLSPIGGVAGQFFDNSGNPLTGGKLYSYAAGTTTPQTTYTSSAGSTAHSNPIVLDAGGRVPGGEIWLTDGSQYKFVLKNSSDVLIGTYDNIVGINSNFINFTNQQEIQTATASQTVFTLATMQYQPATGSLSVFVDGVNQYGPSALYAFTETSSTVVTFTNGLHVGASVKFTTSATNASSYGDASQITYTPAGTGAVATNVQTKLRESVSVKDFGAVGDGVTNDTAAFTLARAANARYFIPAGTYLVDASPDVWLDSFTAAGSAFIKIGATTYTVSNAFAGRLRYNVASNVLTWIVDAVTNNNIIGIQNSQPGTATYFTRGLAFTTDSHFIQAQPATNGGSTDLLFQRSTLNADPAGNRFNLTYEENNDRLLTSYATTASGAPAFDTAMQLVAGVTPTMSFPGLQGQFNQGATVKQRAAGGFEVGLIPVSSTVAEIKQIGGSATRYILFRDGAFGFFGSSGTSQQTITGSRGGNAALASLLTALATTGLIVDGTTA
jgi:hypothetical protein